MERKIFLDMDGTIANLYQTEGWMEDFENERPIFANLQPLVDIGKLRELCQDLKKEGFLVGIITWLPVRILQPEVIPITRNYRIRCIADKIAWIRKHGLDIDEFHALDYGTPKENAIPEDGSIAILVDDNLEIVTNWEKKEGYFGIKVENGNTIDKIRKFLGI